MLHLELEMPGRQIEEVATRIKRWREQADLTLQELGDRAGVSASTIHKIENNQTVPTVSVFLKIARALDLTPADLFAGEGDAEVLACTRTRDRMAILATDGTRVERLSAELADPQLEMWRAEIQPGVGPEEGLAQEDGETIIVCERGEIVVTMRGEDHLLGDGDVLHAKSNIPRTWRNESDAVAVVTVTTCISSRLLPRAEEQIREIVGDRGRPRR
jgi:transcriptional regulator with XRE-family HTH domain